MVIQISVLFLHHGLPFGPHHGFVDKDGNEWRIFPDGRVEPNENKKPKNRKKPKDRKQPKDKKKKSEEKLPPKQ